MESKVNDLNKEVIELDKELAILSNDYRMMVQALSDTNAQLQETNDTLNRFCTKLEKEIVIVDSLQRDMQKYQQYVYGVIVAVIVFVIQQVITMIH